MSGTPRLKHPSLCLRCQDLAEGREAAKEDGRQPWLLTPSSADMIWLQERRREPLRLQKPRKPRQQSRGRPLLFLQGLGSWAPEACAVPGWPGAPGLGSCAVFVVGSYHATLGYLSERGPGTGVAEHRDSQSGLASQSTFSSYPEETDPQDFCPTEYSLVLGTFSI